MGGSGNESAEVGVKNGRFFSAGHNGSVAAELTDKYFTIFLGSVNR